VIAVILPRDRCYTVFEEERMRPQSVWYLLQPPVEFKLCQVDINLGEEYRWRRRSRQRGGVRRFGCAGERKGIGNSASVFAEAVAGS
jgi:hypothetical protein